MIRWTVIAILCAAAPGPKTDLEFTTAPGVVHTREGFLISFALNRSADVEVAVLDAHGRAVRHLAAGVLGGVHPPPPPLKPGLGQALVWDGKEDSGAPATGEPFHVRVRAGMTVGFGKMIGGSPYTGSVVAIPYRAPVNGLVVDDSGNLFVKLMSSVGSHGNSGMWPWHLRKFDPRGEYLKTLLPYPSSTRPEQAAGFNLLPAGAERLTPSLRTSLYPVFAVLGNEIVPRMADGQIVFVHSETRRLTFLSVDGSNRLKIVPMGSWEKRVKCPAWLDIQVALSPDGKTAYYSNVAGAPYDGKKPEDIDPAWPQGRIYRHDLTRPEKDPERFFDFALPDWTHAKYWMPSAWDKKTAAAGIDTDRAGNVVVCDLVNQEVVEIDPAGKKLSASRVSWPDKVLVSRKTGALYVVSRKVSRGALGPGTLSKIVGRGDSAKIVAEIPLEGTVGGAFTIDESGATPVLWLAGSRKEEGHHPPEALVRIEDRGTSLVRAGDRFLNRDERAITFVGYMDVDREAEWVYVTGNGSAVWRFNGETGEGGRIPISAVDLAIGPGGRIFAWGNGSYEGPIVRYTRDLQPAPLGEIRKNAYGHLYGRMGRGQSVCGMDVDARGRVYATFGTNECHVRVYDEEGQLMEFPRREKAGEKGKDTPAVITGVSGAGGSLRVDLQGNIYLLQANTSSSAQAPSGFEKDEAFRNAVGTIYKFPPSGGEIESRNNRAVKVIGATASYSGCGPISQWNAVGSCVCTKPRFDVDDYGRLYIPNAVTFQISVRDNADNEIARVGGYGNFDEQGPKEIPLGWPVTAGASDKYVYVGDALNHRVVRLDKRFALDRSADVPRP